MGEYLTKYRTQEEIAEDYGELDPTDEIDEEEGDWDDDIPTYLKSHYA